jgi:hypothetical protein
MRAKLMNVAMALWLPTLVQLPRGQGDWLDPISAVEPGKEPSGSFHPFVQFLCGKIRFRSSTTGHSSVNVSPRCGALVGNGLIA